MNPRFLTWYSESAVEIDRTAVQLREEAIAKLKGEIVGADLPDLVRLAFGLPPKEAGVSEWLLEGFSENDPKFSASGHLEQSILAGALLVELFSPDEGDALADAAALLMLSVSLDGELPGEYHQDFVAEARSYVRNRSRDLRLEFKWPTLKAPSFSADPNSASNLAAVHADLDKAAKAVAALSRQMQSVLGAVSTRFSLQQEEIDVAWWVFGGRLRSTNELVEHISPLSAPFLIGSELGSLISVVPGPASAEGLLDRMLAHLAEKRAAAIPITAVTSETPPGWAEDWLAQVGPTIVAAEVLPLAAVAAKAAQGADMQEITGWAKRTLGFDPLAGRSSLVLATQAYRETITAKALTASWDPPK